MSSEPADFVKQYLNSIGTEQARAAVKNQLVLGDLSFQYLNVAGIVTGNVQFVSEGDKFVSVLKIPSPDYRGEQFTSRWQKDCCQPAETRCLFRPGPVCVRAQ